MARKTAAERREAFMAEYRAMTPDQRDRMTAETIVRSHGGSVDLIMAALRRKREARAQ